MPQKGLPPWAQYLASHPIPTDAHTVSRGRFYRSISFRGWGGASGHDCVIIAYDALLGSRGCWVRFRVSGILLLCMLPTPIADRVYCGGCPQDQLVRRGVLHGGDNDSTGTIAGAWWGACYGFRGVPGGNYKAMEDVATSLKLGGELLRAFGSADHQAGRATPAHRKSTSGSRKQSCR